MLGDRIKYCRLKKGATLKEVGSIVSVSESTMSMYENNKRTPSDETKIQLADYFGVSIDFLLERTDDPTPYVSNTETELTPREHLEQLFNDPRLQDKELAFKNFDELDDDDINSIIEYIEGRYLLAEKRKKNDSKG